MGYFLSKSQKISLCYSHAKLTLSRVISYFNYCSLVWHFGSLVNIHATEKLHERAIRFIYNDYETDYFQILRENNLCTLYADRLRGMCCEIYKTKKGISSAYINDLLSARPWIYHSRQYLNLYVPEVNQITSGYTNFSVTEPKIWYSLATSIKVAKSYDRFQLNKKEYSTLVRIRKLLFKASHLNLILPNTQI